MFLVGGVAARALGRSCGRSSGRARIEEQAIAANGAVTGGTVGGLSVIGVEYCGAGLNLAACNRSGFVNSGSTVGSVTFNPRRR